jgi:hypothetical protein
MSQQLSSRLRSLGVTPWQLVLGVACIGSWWATVQPLPGQLSKLTETVQVLTTKVEIHTVLLAEIAEVKSDLKDIRAEIAALRFKSAAAKPSPQIEAHLPEQNELSPRRNLGKP